MRDMAYEIDDLPFEEFFVPVSNATAALVRLDERLSRSPIHDGMIERLHMHDAGASMWLEGELVHMEDLVLHDALMDNRMPSHALTIAHAVLRMRRQIAGKSADWALGPAGIQQLLGRSIDLTTSEVEPRKAKRMMISTRCSMTLTVCLRGRVLFWKAWLPSDPSRKRRRVTRCFMTMTGMRMRVCRNGAIVLPARGICHR